MYYCLTFATLLIVNYLVMNTQYDYIRFMCSISVADKQQNIDI